MLGHPHNMHRLLTIYILIALAYAQNGYEYKKPGRPFTATTANPSGYPGPYRAMEIPTAPQTNQGLPGSGQNTGYSEPGEVPGYSSPSAFQGQGPTGASYPGQSQTGPSYSSKGDIPSPDYSGPPQNYPRPEHGAGKPGEPTGQYGASGNEGSGYQGPTVTGPSFPGLTGRPSAPSGPDDEQTKTPSGQPAHSGPGRQEENITDLSSSIPGIPGKDYPIYSKVTATDFECEKMFMDGYFADITADCQVFHVCANNQQYDFLCPNGTIFSQIHHVCVWWYQFKCKDAPKFFALNQPDLSRESMSSPMQDHSPYPYEAPLIATTGPSPGSDILSLTGGIPPYSAPGNVPQTQGSESYPGTGHSLTPSGPRGYPNSQSSVPGTAPSSSQGYPYGKPSGPIFPTSRPQSTDVKTPNREYLPPVEGIFKLT